MGITDQLNQINKDLKEIKGEEEKSKSRIFKLPFGKKVSNSQAKKNYVTVIKVNENGFPEFLKEQIIEQTVLIDGIPRLATPEYIIHYKKCPIMLLPSSSVEPINWREMHKRSLSDGSNAAGYRLLMNRMKLSTVEGVKKKMSGWIAWVFGAIVLGIIGYALFTGGI
jgi:hypothetical protein